MVETLNNFTSQIDETNGVHRIAIDTPWPLGWVSIYIFKIDDSYVMYDAGLDMISWKRLFFSELKKLNISLTDIDYCFVSHSHMDHYGLVRRFKQKNPNIQIITSDITHNAIEWESDPNNYDEIMDIAKGNAKLMRKYGMNEKQTDQLIEWSTFWQRFGKPLKPDRILQDDEEISFTTNKLKMIWTPGHSLGHMCIFDERNRHLFSGDHILSRITPHIGNFLVNPILDIEYDFGDILKHYLESLDRIDNLNAKILFPAHQDIIFEPHERIVELKKHHENRLNDMANIIKNKPLTPLEISQIHFGDLDDMNMAMAILETLGHLIYLENTNKIERIEKDDKILFVSN